MCGILLRVFLSVHLSLWLSPILNPQGSKRGESWGLAHTPTRYKQTWLRPHTPIKGLFLTGQDLVSVGVMGALVSGFLTAIAVYPILAWKNLRVLTRL